MAGGSAAENTQLANITGNVLNAQSGGDDSEDEEEGEDDESTTEWNLSKF